MAGQHVFTIALIQMQCASDPDTNLAHATRKVQEAIRGGARLICLPELFRSHYFCQQEAASWFDLAEPIPGPTIQAMAQLAREAQVVLVVPIFERRAPGVYHNSVVILDADGSLAGHYRKMHIPDDPGYYEKFYFTPGDKGFQAVGTRVATIGPLICWDQWFPEAARLTVLQGAQILVYPTAIGWQASEPPHDRETQRQAWQTIQRSHAIANGVFVAAINRVGYEQSNLAEEGIEFWGSSFLCDPFGVILAEASVEQEEILLVSIDLNRIETVRRHWPFLRDRRVDAYSGITKRLLDEDDPGEC